MSSVLFSTTVTSKIEEKEKVKNDIVKRQKYKLSAYIFRTMYAVRLEEVVIFFPLPTLSLSLPPVFSSLRAMHTEERKKKNEVIVKGVVVDFSVCVCVRTRKKKIEKGR